MRPLSVPPVAALLLAACSLGPRPDTSRYFTLPDAAGPPSGATPIASVGVGPVTLPPYLSRPEVATRVGPEQIGYSAGDRWAAPLDELVARALLEELRARLPARGVVRWPWPLGTPPEVSVSVEFIRLEGDAAGGATLQARWTVSAEGRPSRSGETRLREAGAPGDVPGSVAALGRALGALAGEMAGALHGP